MTENKTIVEIKRWTGILMNAGSQCTLEMGKAQDMAIKSLEEIQEVPSNKNNQGMPGGNRKAENTET